MSTGLAILLNILHKAFTVKRGSQQSLQCPIILFVFDKGKMKFEFLEELGEPSKLYVFIAAALVFIVGRDWYVLLNDGHLYSFRTLQQIDPSESWLSLLMFIVVLVLKILLLAFALFYLGYSVLFYSRKFSKRSIKRK